MSAAAFLQAHLAHIFQRYLLKGYQGLNDKRIRRQRPDSHLSLIGDAEKLEIEYRVNALHSHVYALFDQLRSDLRFQRLR